MYQLKTLSDELNNETVHIWYPKEVHTYQIQNKIYKEDISVFWQESYTQLDPLNL